MKINIMEEQHHLEAATINLFLVLNLGYDVLSHLLKSIKI